MARISLRSVIDDTFIRRFQGLASGSGSGGDSVVAALKGQSSQASVSTGLRVGARTFATAVQGLNSGIAFLNTSKATLEKLGDITDTMITLAEKASQSGTSSQERYDADLEFKKLGGEFKRVVEEAKLGDREFLKVEGISEFLKVIGLDKENSESIQKIFDKFKVPLEDDTLASEEAQGPRPASIPVQAYSATAAFTAEYEKIFDDEVTLSTRPNAYKVMGDLNALKEQIDGNIKALDNGVEIIGKNIDLVRAAGFAFLELSDQIADDDDAQEVAELVRKRISQDAPAALAQAENLEAIVVAALSLDLDKLGVKN